MEEDDEGDSAVMVLREDPKTMTAKEQKRWLRTLERNMSQPDYGEYAKSDNR